MILWFWNIFENKYDKGDVLLSREISLKVIYEKVKFSNCECFNNFHENEMTAI